MPATRVGPPCWKGSKRYPEHSFACARQEYHLPARIFFSSLSAGSASGARMSTLAEKFREFVIPTYGRFDLDIAHGSGCRVWDFDGREFLDFGAGIAVCSLGHAHPEITEAISKQAATLVHTSNLYRTAPQAELAERLVGIAGSGKVFFCNSGGEANEGLIKLARRFGSTTKRHEILTFDGSFHGRTMAGISATGQQKVKTGFGPLLDGFRHLPFGDLDAVAAAVGPSTVAILVEPVQGEGGIHIAREAFLTGLRELCDKHNLLLLFDEIQCGLGRTGEWCGWKSLAPGVQPDGVSWAKGIANGFPLGAFWVAGGGRDDRGPLCDLLGPEATAQPTAATPWLARPASKFSRSSNGIISAARRSNSETTWSPFCGRRGSRMFPRCAPSGSWSGFNWTKHRSPKARALRRWRRSCARWARACWRFPPGKRSCGFFPRST